MCGWQLVLRKKKKKEKIMHIKRMLLVHYQTTAALEKIVLANIKSHCSFIHEKHILPFL